MENKHIKETKQLKTINIGGAHQICAGKWGNEEEQERTKHKTRIATTDAQGDGRW